MDEKEILAIWDDHDFGLNDGGGDYPYKQDAEKMFLNFWNIPQTTYTLKGPLKFFKNRYWEVVNGV